MRGNPSFFIVSLSWNNNNKLAVILFIDPNISYMRNLVCQFKPSRGFNAFFRIESHWMYCRSPTCMNLQNTLVSIVFCILVHYAHCHVVLKSKDFYYSFIHHWWISVPWAVLPVFTDTVLLSTHKRPTQYEVLCHKKIAYDKYWNRPKLSNLIKV